MKDKDVILHSKLKKIRERLEENYDENISYNLFIEICEYSIQLFEIIKLYYIPRHQHIVADMDKMTSIYDKIFTDNIQISEKAVNSLAIIMKNVFCLSFNLDLSFNEDFDINSLSIAFKNVYKCDNNNLEERSAFLVNRRMARLSTSLQLLAASFGSIDKISKILNSDEDDRLTIDINNNFYKKFTYEELLLTHISFLEKQVYDLIDDNDYKKVNNYHCYQDFINYGIRAVNYCIDSLIDFDMVEKEPEHILECLYKFKNILESTKIRSKREFYYIYTSKNFDFIQPLLHSLINTVKFISNYHNVNDIKEYLISINDTKKSNINKYAGMLGKYTSHAIYNAGVKSYSLFLEPFSNKPKN